MTQDVNIPFRLRLEAGETTFKINVPRRFIDKSERKFGFECLTLMPDYYSKQAALYGMDPESETTTTVEHPIKLEFRLESRFHQTDHSHTWGQTANNVHMGVVIKSLNAHFQRIKPEGRVYPPVYIDWFHLRTLFGDDTEGFYKDNAKELYGEEFDPVKHKITITEEMRNFGDINTFKFPTSDDETVMSDIRLRIIMAPNTTLAFSNTDLPEFMGFGDLQLPEERVNKQVQFYNNRASSLHIIDVQKEPSVFVARGARTSKVHVYFYAKEGESPVGYISTTRAGERKPAQLAEDYSKGISALAKSCNFNLRLQFVEEEGRFKFVYPSNPYVTINIRVPSYVAHQLGYDEIERIKPTMIPKAMFKPDVDQKDYAKKATTLVLDTGMVVVNLEQNSSQQISQFQTTMMAILEPTREGVMKINNNSMLVPRVSVSYYNPVLEFVLHRFNEIGEPASLEWKVGAYIQGVLSGKV